jgi:hypothetical protein
MGSAKAIFAFLLYAAVSQGATVATSSSLTAAATNADAGYCFARVRGLDPDRQPQAYLVLRLRVNVSYRNNGTRPLILTLERERTVYTALKLGAPMNKFHGLYSLLEPSYTVMKALPADVSPESPIDPKNDVFTVIPAGGEMTPPLSEEITIPVDRQSLFRRDPDLRGRRLYLRLQFAHRQLSPGLEADLSDRWTRFGVPWTGTLTTNLFVVDVPAAPQAAPCKDRYDPGGTEAPVTGK